MKVTVFLRKDHEAVKSLFAKYKKNMGRPQNGKKEVFEEIHRELSLHSQMETEIFYPALENTTSTRALELASEAHRAHQEVDNLLEELSGMNQQDKNFDAAVSRLIELVESHIETEEEEIFEEARKSLPEYRLEELGLEMEDRRRILTQLAA